MPIVRIDVVRGRPEAELRAILDGVHQALVECFRIPEQDRNQILTEHAAERFEARRGPAFTIIELTVFPGRSAEAKRRLYETIVANLQRAPGIRPEEIFIVLHEPPLDNWGIRGGQQASQIDLGFNLKV